MKKVLYLLMALSLICISLAACNDTKEQKEREKRRDAAYASGDYETAEKIEKEIAEDRLVEFTC